MIRLYLHNTKNSKNDRDHRLSDAYFCREPLLLVKCFAIEWTLTYFTYMVMEYCVGVLQEILESAPEKKFPIWQAHK